MAEQRDSATPLATPTYMPTPTQAENDLAAIGQLPVIKDYDGSPIDPSSNNPSIPVAPGAPHITTIAPTTGALPAAPIALTVNGTGFTAAAKVIFNGNAVATTFVSASQLTCHVTAASAGSYPVEVEEASGFSNTVQFTFTATALLEANEEESSPESPTPPRRQSSRR